MIFSVKFSKNDPLRQLRWFLSETCMHRLRKKYVSTDAKATSCQYFNNKICMSHSSVFIFKQKTIFSIKFSKRDLHRYLWWLVSETRMQRVPENMFLLSLPQGRFSNQIITSLGPTPPYL